MRRIIFVLFGLMLIPSVYAQADFDGAADMILTFLTNDNMIAVFGILFTFVLIFTAFMAALRNVPFFKKGSNISPQGKMFALSLALIGTLGMFTANVITNGAPLDTARRIMEIGGVFGVTTLAIALFLMAFKGFQTDQTDKSLARGLAAAGLGFLFVGMLTARPGYLAWGWLFAIIAVIFYVFKLFVLSGTGGGTTTPTTPTAPNQGQQNQPDQAQAQRDAQQDAERNLHRNLNELTRFRTNLQGLSITLGNSRFGQPFDETETWRWWDRERIQELNSKLPAMHALHQADQRLAGILDPINNSVTALLGFVPQDQTQFRDALSRASGEIRSIKAENQGREEAVKVMHDFFTKLVQVLNSRPADIDTAIHTAMEQDNAPNTINHRFKNLNHAGDSFDWQGVAPIDTSNGSSGTPVHTPSVAGVNKVIDVLQHEVASLQNRLGTLQYSIQDVEDKIQQQLGH